MSQRRRANIAMACLGLLALIGTSLGIGNMLRKVPGNERAAARVPGLERQLDRTQQELRVLQETRTSVLAVPVVVREVAGAEPRTTTTTRVTAGPTTPTAPPTPDPPMPPAPPTVPDDTGIVCMLAPILCP